MTAARFEIIHGDHGWHARFRASNGRIIMSSEQYRRRATALRAIEIMAEALNCGITVFGVRTICQHFDHAVVEVREVDGRSGS